MPEQNWKGAIMSQSVEKQIDLLFKITNLSLNGMTTFSGVVLQILNYVDKADPTAKLLKKHVKKGGELSFSMCQPGISKEIALKLDEAGVPYVKSNTGIMDGATVFVFAGTDAEKVRVALDEYRSEQSHGGIIAKSVMQHGSHGNIRCIEGLDTHEAMLFCSHAANAGVNVSVEEPGKGEYSISFATKDKHIMNNIKATVALELTGKAGLALKKQLQYENDNAMRITGRVLDDKKNTFYVVDLDNAVMKSTDEKITFEGSSGQIEIYRNDKDFNLRASEFISGMRGPIDLEKREMKEYMELNHDKRRKLLVNKDKEHGRPQYLKEEYEAIRKLQDNRILYEAKLAKENPEQEILQYSYFDDEMRMATFEEYEQINEEVAHDKTEAESGVVDPEIYDDARSRYRGYQDKKEEIPYEAQEFAENIILEKSTDEMIYDNEIDDQFLDIMNDKNANRIPDDLENPSDFGH